MNHPIYKHRAFASSIQEPANFSTLDLVDSVGLSVEQAEAVILQMQHQFEGGTGRLSDCINHSTLEAIRKELLDIRTVVEWYFEEIRSCGGRQS